jgi:hypothetical protein
MDIENAMFLGFIAEQPRKEYVLPLLKCGFVLEHCLPIQIEPQRLDPIGGIPLP